MKSIGIIKNRATSIIYPFTIQITRFKVKFEILQPNKIVPDSLIKSFRYSSEIINTSVIYSKSSRILYRFGPTQLMDDIVNRLDEKNVYAMFIAGYIPMISIGNYDISTVANNLSGGSAEKTKGLLYDTIIAEELLVRESYVYKVEAYSQMKLLEYFIKNKDLRLETKDYKTLDTYEKIQEYVDSVDWTQIAYTAKDTETTGLNFYNGSDECHIVGMSHSYKEKQGVYIPFRYQGLEILEPKKVFEIMRPIYDNTRQVWQNGDFDKRVFRSEGIEERVDEELTVLQKLINPSDKQPIALKYVARKLLNEDTIELDEILGNNFNAKRVEYIPLDLMTVYACSDTDYTLRIFKILKDKVNARLWKLYQFDVINYNIVSDTNWRGLPVRKTELERFIQNTSDDLKKMKEFILNYIYTESSALKAKNILISKGCDASKITEDKIKIIIDSPQFKKYMAPRLRGLRQPELDLDYAADKSRILYELLEYPVLRYTKGGAVSTGAEYFNDIDVYVRDEPVQIMKEDLISSDNKSILLEMDEVNNKVFPLGYMLKRYSTKQHEHQVYKGLSDMMIGEFTFSPYKFNGTETGRLSNGIQTIPSYAKKVVGFEEDSKYGMIIFDFDQIELRGVHNEAIRLWESIKNTSSIGQEDQDILDRYDWHGIVDVFNSFWKDVHSEMTASFSNCKVKDVTKAMRKKGKTVNFAGVYGATPATMARNDLLRAKTPEQRQEIIDSYEDTKNRWLSANLHLYNYFRNTQAQGLEPIDEAEIPYNIDSKNVGRTVARSGRQRFYILDNLTKRAEAHISNASRNQYIQSYCRDIYFTAIQRLEKALRENGFSQEDIHSIVYVHDEEGLMYDKTKINPLWLAALVYQNCCMEIEGSPIKYYCTPAIASNWEEGKADKYEIPKEMLSKLSTKLEDYEILDTLNHRDYVLDKIKNFYCDKVFEISMRYVNNNILELNNFDTDENYYLIGKLKMYQEGITDYTGIKDYDNLLNCLARRIEQLNQNNVTVKWQGKEIQWEEIIQYPVEFGDIIVDKEEDLDEFDLDAFMESDNELFNFEEIDSKISQTSEFINSQKEGIITSVLNRTSVKELDKKFTNLHNMTPKKKSLKNILYEQFLRKATIFLGSMGGKRISKTNFLKIDKMLKDCSCNEGIDIFYSIGGESVKTTIKVPLTFKFDKFDNFVESLRV